LVRASEKQQKIKDFCFHGIHSKTGTPFGCCKFLFDVLNYFVD